MKFRIFIFLISFLSSQALYSQRALYLGINGGITYSNVKSSGDFSFGNFDYLAGYTAGLSLETMIKSRFSLVTTIDYLQNGYNQNLRSNIDIPPDFSSVKSYMYNEYQITQQYLTNSWMAGYKIGNKLSVSVYAGAYWGVFIGASAKNYDCIYIDPEEAIEIADPSLSPGYHESTTSKKLPNSLFSSLDFGISSMIRMGYNWNEKYQATLSIGNKTGLTDVSTASMFHEIDHFNRSFDISLGLKMKLR